MKKLYFILFASLIVLAPNFVNAENSNVYYTNNKGVEMSYEEYNNLVNLGFTEFEIRNLSEETFNENKNLEGEVVGSSEKYYKTVTNIFNQSTTTEVSEEEYNSENNNNGIMPAYVDGYVETTYKKLRTIIAASGTRYYYQTNLEWKTMPAKRSYDIIGIGIDSSTVTILGTSTVNQYVEYSNGTSQELSSYYNYKGSNGAGAAFQLPSSSSVSGLSYTIRFLVDKVTSATNVTLNAYGDYAHATSTVTSTQAQKYVVDRSGIYLDSSVEDYYDSIQTAQSVANVSW